MQITLGLELDSGAFPDELTSFQATCGTAVLGPLGLIDVMETRLGLSGRSSHQAVRIGQYLKCLKELDDESRFYSESFAADAWSTAKEVLSWRDELKTAGWNANTPTGMSLRLDTLLQIEAVAASQVPPGFGDRLWAVLGAIPIAKPIGIESIELAEPKHLWPFPWSMLFDGLEKLGVKVASAPFGQPAGVPTQSDLEVLRQSVISKTCWQKPLSGDGSIVALSSDTREEAAEALACWLAADKEANSEVVIIREDGSRILDDRLQRFGLPRLGTQSRSRWRAALQVLSLAFSCSWAPFDPYRLLEFLSLPKSPVPKSIAVLFENALREHPGIGGPRWESAWEKARQQISSWLERDGFEGRTLAEHLSRLEADLKLWLEGIHFDRSAEMPATSIIEICHRVRDWAAKRGGKEGDSLLLAAASFASHIADAVAATGLLRISKPQLDRIMDSIVGEGAEDPQDRPQASPWSCVMNPGQIWKPAKTIIWWDCIVSGNSTFHSPWSKTERKALAENGVLLESSTEKRLREVRSWQQPTMMATEHLVLVMPAAIGDSITRPHPVWEEIRFRLGDKDGSKARKITLFAGKAFECPGIEICGRILRRELIGPEPLPAAKEEWTVPIDRSWVRSTESYSSMSRLIECPVSWVLSYGMNLRPSPLMSLPEGSTLMGILSHAVVENLLSESAKYKPSAARDRAKDIFDRLVPQMAASLLEHGKELERSQHRETVGRAVERLLELIEIGGFEVVGLEREFSKPLLKDQVFMGRIDLLLKSADGQLIVWDLKWSGKSKYRKEEIRGGKALQLAAYAWVVSDGKASRGPAGYFMLAQGELLSAPCAGVPDYCQLPDVDLDSVWASGIKAYEKRIEELGAGAIRAGGFGSTNEEPSDDVLLLDAPCKWCDFTSLCGWRDGLNG